MAKNKSITIDELAVMVKIGFDKTATKEQIEKIDERLKNVEQKLEDMGDVRTKIKILEDALGIE